MLSNRRQRDQSPNPQIHYGDIFQVVEEPLTQKKLSIVPKRFFKWTNEKKEWYK